MYEQIRAKYLVNSLENLKKSFIACKFVAMNDFC